MCANGAKTSTDAIKQYLRATTPRWLVVSAHEVRHGTQVQWRPTSPLATTTIVTFVIFAHYTNGIMKRTMHKQFDMFIKWKHTILTSQIQWKLPNTREQDTNQQLTPTHGACWVIHTTRRHRQVTQYFLLPNNPLQTTTIL